jgi:putative hydrolase of the HAD superfamily
MSPLAAQCQAASGNNRTMIETIAFDFGKVIGHFDHSRTLAKLTPHTDMSAEQMYREIYCSELEDEFESGRISEGEFLRRFRQLCRLTCDEVHLAGAVADIFSPNEALCALVPQLKQRFRLVLGSNTNPIHARQFLPQFADTLRHFDALVLSHEIGARKPRAEFYQHVIKASGGTAERCVFIDDLAANVAGAHACGLHGIVYTDVESLLVDLRSLGVIFERLPPGCAEIKSP